MLFLRSKFQVLILSLSPEKKTWAYFTYHSLNHHISFIETVISIFNQTTHKKYRMHYQTAVSLPHGGRESWQCRIAFPCELWTCDVAYLLSLVHWQAATGRALILHSRYVKSSLALVGAHPWGAMSRSTSTQRRCEREVSSPPHEGEDQPRLLPDCHSTELRPPPYYPICV